MGVGLTVSAKRVLPRAVEQASCDSYPYLVRSGREGAGTTCSLALVAEPYE